MSFSTPEGVVCVGGADNDRCYREVFRLEWNPRSRTLATTVLPSLPRPLAFMSGAMVGGTLYVTGGQQTIQDPTFEPVFWALDLSRSGQADFGWRELPAWPGPGRILPVAIDQSNGLNDCLYLFGGRIPGADTATALLTDAYRYDPAQTKWASLGPIGGGAGVSVMAGTAIALHRREIAIVGGSRGTRFLQLEKHDLKIAALRRELKSASPARARELQREIDSELRSKIEIYTHHTGFSREVLSYRSTTQAWTKREPLPYASPVTTIAIRWGETWVIPSGEIQPGIRTTRILRARPLK